MKLVDTMQTHSIYVIEGPGQAYVGRTYKDVAWRWANHLRDAFAGSQLAMHCAIREHGPEAFTLTVFAQTRGDWRDAEDLENEVICQMLDDGVRLYNAVARCETELRGYCTVRTRTTGRYALLKAARAAAHPLSFLGGV